MTANTHVCPAEHAGMLDNSLRKLAQNPFKILSSYVKSGMKAADIGCGPGFFTLPMAQMVGPNGHIYGYDLQQKMLEKIADKINGSELEQIISLQRCETTTVNFVEKVDFILAFYMLHEVPDQKQLLQEMYDNLNKGGKVLIVEPFFHVSKKQFNTFQKIAKLTGYSQEPGPKLFFSRSMLLGR